MSVGEVIIVGFKMLEIHSNVKVKHVNFAYLDL